jgi:hypothetical protein
MILSCILVKEHNVILFSYEYFQNNLPNWSSYEHLKNPSENLRRREPKIYRWQQYALIGGNSF